MDDKRSGLGLHDEIQEFQVFYDIYYLLFEKAKIKESLTNAEKMLSSMFSKQ